MTGHAEPTVAVVICANTEGRWNEMMASVGSATSQTRRAAEIILVIDHNPALLRRAAFELPDVRVIPNTNQRGLAGARNTGVAAATSDIVAFLDDDAFAATNWLAALVAPYADPWVLGVGWRAIPQWRSGRPAWFPPEFDWVVGCSHPGMPEERSPVAALAGASMSLRRELLLDCGGFEFGLDRIGTHPTGLTAAELCVRVQRFRPLGRYIYEPKAVVRQGIPQCRCTWSHFRSQCYSEGLSRAVVNDSSQMHWMIPRGITRSLAAVLRGDRKAAAAGVALCAGVAITGAGYVMGSRSVTPPGDRVQRERKTTAPARDLPRSFPARAPEPTRMILQNREIHL